MWWYFRKRFFSLLPRRVVDLHPIEWRIKSWKFRNIGIFQLWRFFELSRKKKFFTKHPIYLRVCYIRFKLHFKNRRFCCHSLYLRDWFHVHVKLLLTVNLSTLKLSRMWRKYVGINRVTVSVMKVIVRNLL